MKKALFLSGIAIFAAAAGLTAGYFFFRGQSETPAPAETAPPVSVSTTATENETAADDKNKIRIVVSYPEDHFSNARDPEIKIIQNGTVLHRASTRSSIYFTMIRHGQNECHSFRIIFPTMYAVDEPPEDKVFDLEELLCDADNSGNKRYLIITEIVGLGSIDAGYGSTTIFDTAGNTLREIARFSSVGTPDVPENICGCRHEKGGLWLTWCDEIYYGGVFGGVYPYITMGFATSAERKVYISADEKIFCAPSSARADSPRVKKINFFNLAVYLAAHGRLKELRTLALRNNFTESEIDQFTVNFYNAISGKPYTSSLLGENCDYSY